MGWGLREAVFGLRDGLWVGLVFALKMYMVLVRCGSFGGIHAVIISRLDTPPALIALLDLCNWKIPFLGLVWSLWLIS